MVIVNYLFYRKKIIIFAIIFLFSLPVIAKIGDKAVGSFNLIEFNSDDPKIFKNIIINKNVLINFWATYCEPCKKEIPEILSLASKHPQVQIYFINIDSISDSVKAREEIRNFGIENISFLDIYQVGAEAYIKPKLSVPASFLIDKKGHIIFESVGFENDTIEKIEKAVKKLK